jgi:alpha-amylase/alpha-mannosidase (GH57 family)
VSHSKFVAIHGHFYQPPRESPWLERIEVQDSAAPYHDWNERVSAESYEPNIAARRVDGENRIVDIVDNFDALSFDVGPTLLAWLARRRPAVYAAILAADRRSRATRGHGNAIAQAYGHPILPLCTRRDKVTQVRWGLADFRHRFGRDAEGMWLPETAADRETLEVLAEEGIGFTLLAPGQAASVREPGDDWRPGGIAVDPGRAYRWDGPSGRSLALLFYDGSISHGIAFDGLLRSGDALAARVLAGLDARASAQLVHVATDGETYGHHHRFGEMALAAACARIEASGAATLTNHAAFLAAHPPTALARVVERSSWSCAHGVERWRGDCGCRAGHSSGWTQRWRGPLREALDWLREAVDPLYEARAGTLLKDPWAARDAYVDVILDRSPASVERFFGDHALRQLGPGDRVQALQCLELQRHRLLMYTSCGWFFDEISGIETVQVLRYAARVLQLAQTLGGDAGLEAELVRRLGAAPSNRPEVGNGAGVWRRDVTPAVTDLPRVAAHYALTALPEGAGDPAELDAFRIERLTWARVSAGERSLALGRVRVTAQVTGEREDVDVLALHGEAGESRCHVRPAADGASLAAARTALFRSLTGHGPLPPPAAFEAHFGGRSYGTEAVFVEERRRLLARERRASFPAPPAALPPLARAAAEELAALAAAGVVGPRVARIRAVLAEARSAGVGLGLRSEDIAPQMSDALDRVLAALRAGVTAPAVDDALALLALGAELGAIPALWTAQNDAIHLWRAGAPRDRAILAPLMAALGFAPSAFPASPEQGRGE